MHGVCACPKLMGKKGGNNGNTPNRNNQGNGGGRMAADAVEPKAKD